MGTIVPKMGTRSKQPKNLVRALFSPVQLRVLALLFGQPDEKFYGRQIIDAAGSGRGAVQRQLEKLTEAGVINRFVSGNRIFYQANRDSPIFDELRRIILKTVGVVEPLARVLKPHRKRIEVAFIFGSVARGHDTAKSDIDLMIIAHDVAYGEVFSDLHIAERTLRRPVNPTLMSPAEWAEKKAQGNSFVKKIIQQPKLFVFGAEHDL